MVRLQYSGGVFFFLNISLYGYKFFCKIKDGFWVRSHINSLFEHLCVCGPTTLFQIENTVEFFQKKTINQRLLRLITFAKISHQTRVYIFND